MNEGLKVTKMFLLLKQTRVYCGMYNETHLLKCVRDDFMQKCLNSVSPSNHAIPNLIKKFENESRLDDILH